jgi:DNA-binding SARP family transcriptional activator/tetratricopeptide (TPR) repeat protein
VVEFRVLGPVQVVAAGRALELGPPQQRLVLAVLASTASQVVSVETVIDRVWDQAPAGARRTLHVAITRLRRILERADTADQPPWIAYRDGGYLLQADPDRVDVVRYQRLVTRARDPHCPEGERVASLRQALELWRGEPLAGLSGAWATRTRWAWSQRHLDTVIAWARAELAAGDPAAVVAPLRELAAEHPLTESLTEVLMLGLHALGRPAEALAAYQATRQRLADQLGTDPSNELRTMHERILRGQLPLPPTTARTGALQAAGAHDPGPQAHQAPAAPVAMVVPFQLPADTVHFVGRAEHVAHLLDLCTYPDEARGSGGSAPVVICAVEGMAGIGKTALAVHAAHQMADRFADGVLLTDLHGYTPDTEPTPPGQALDHLLRGLGVPGPQIPPSLQARIGLYRSLVARRRVLIVLDNAADETQLAPLLPARGVVIVTSRRHLAGLDEATHLTLPALDPAEAAALFRGLARDRATPADQPVIDRIVAVCGHLPLAVRVTAARLRLAPTATPATLCAELTDALDTGRELDWLSDGHRAVGAALAVSYRHLTHEQQHAFQLCGLHSGPDIEPYALAALANTTIDHARQLLDELHAASLLDQPTHRRYSLHDLVAAYATRLAAELPAPDRHTALGRLYDHYAATSTRAMSLTYPWQDDHQPSPPASPTPTPTLTNSEQAQAWLDTEINNLLATAHHAPTQQRADHTLHQSTTLHGHLRIGGRYTQATLLHQRALAIAHQSGNHTAEQNALNGLGDIHWRQGRYGPATDCLEQALIIARRTGNQIAEQNALNGLGTVHRWQGRYGPATDCYEQALAIAHQTGNHTAELDTLRGLGYLHYVQGRFGPATDYFEQALAIARQTGNQIAEQNALNGLGGVHRLQGGYRPATDCYEQALAIARQTGNRNGEQSALIGLGHLLYMQGRYVPATDYFEQALAIARQIGNRTGELYVLIGLGGVHRLQGGYGPATDYFEQVLAITRETGDRNGQFEAHHGLGRVHHATNNHHDALRHHQTALDLAVHLDQPTDQARAHDGLAHTHQARGNTSQAHHHWHTALHLLTTAGTDHTDEPNVTTTAIRAHLLKLNNHTATDEDHDTVTAPGDVRSHRS